jgi:crossover junction endodeoxyribonuclease RuvC
VRVLGFDPGTATTGYGVVEGRGNRLAYIAHGVISTPAGAPFELRLKTIYEQASALVREHRPDAVAIEKLYFARNVTMGVAVAQARGVLALVAAQANLPVGEFSPLEVKNAVVGYGKATKQQVQDMIKILLTLDTIPRPDDAADALALAICLVHAGPRHVATLQ